MSVETYENCMAQIERRLDLWSQRTGRRHGLDATRKTPSSMFYLPCQAGDWQALNILTGETKRAAEEPFKPELGKQWCVQSSSFWHDSRYLWADAAPLPVKLWREMPVVHEPPPVECRAPMANDLLVTEEEAERLVASRPRWTYEELTAEIRSLDEAKHQTLHERARRRYLDVPDGQGRHTAIFGSKRILERGGLAADEIEAVLRSMDYDGHQRENIGEMMERHGKEDLR